MILCNIVECRKIKSFLQLFTLIVRFIKGSTLLAYEVPAGSELSKNMI